MIMAEERRFLKAREAFEQVLRFVEQAQRQDLRIDLLERRTLALLLEVASGVEG
jgi:hypothetical protein